jgi:hypothetical protein
MASGDHAVPPAVRSNSSLAGRIRTAVRRSALATAVATASIVAGVLLLGAAPAMASTILLITPMSIEAGFSVTVSAVCDDNVDPAEVSSRAFGSVTLQPAAGKLKTTVIIPSTTAAGTYAVRLVCADGQVANSSLDVTNGGATAPAISAETVTPNTHVGPATGGGEMAASSGARLAAYGGVGAVAIGVVLWITAVRLRRSGRRP